MGLARKVPAKSFNLRLALRNIYHTASLTPAITLSIGLGLTLILTIVEVDLNIRNALAKGSRAKRRVSSFSTFAAVSARRCTILSVAAAQTAYLKPCR